LDGWQLKVSKGRARVVKLAPECGDASACLKLRIPVTRRDHSGVVQNMCPYEISQIAPKNTVLPENVHRRGQ
jgi:hypothetical protein